MWSKPKRSSPLLWAKTSKTAASSSRTTPSTSSTWTSDFGAPASSRHILLEPMIYQLGWTTLPGLRGLGVSEFRATPTDTPDNERGVAVRFASDAERDEFLKAAEGEF